MRRRTLKRLSPKCHRVQIRNPRCSQSRCHPLWGETIQISCSSLIQESKLSSVPTWIEFFNQRWHRVGDRVSSNEEVVSQIPPWTFQNTETKKKKVLHQHLDTSLTVGVTVIPWAKASCTSPPTPISESWGVCVGVVTAESEWMGVGMERLIVWLGEERGEPGPWVCGTESLF